MVVLMRHCEKSTVTEHCAYDGYERSVYLMRCGRSSLSIEMGALAHAQIVSRGPNATNGQ